MRRLRLVHYTTPQPTRGTRLSREGRGTWRRVHSCHRDGGFVTYPLLQTTTVREADGNLRTKRINLEGPEKRLLRSIPDFRGLERPREAAAAGPPGLLPGSSRQPITPGRSLDGLEITVCGASRRHTGCHMPARWSESKCSPRSRAVAVEDCVLDWFSALLASLPSRYRRPRFRRSGPGLEDGSTFSLAYRSEIRAMNERYGRYSISWLRERRTN